MGDKATDENLFLRQRHKRERKTFASTAKGVAKALLAIAPLFFPGVLLRNFHGARSKSSFHTVPFQSSRCVTSALHYEYKWVFSHRQWVWIKHFCRVCKRLKLRDTLLEVSWALYSVKLCKLNWLLNISNKNNPKKMNILGMLFGPFWRRLEGEGIAFIEEQRIYVFIIADYVWTQLC